MMDSVFSLRRVFRIHVFQPTSLCSRRILATVAMKFFNFLISSAFLNIFFRDHLLNTFVPNKDDNQSIKLGSHSQILSWLSPQLFHLSQEPPSPNYRNQAPPPELFSLWVPCHFQILEPISTWPVLVAGLHKLCQPASLAGRKGRENEEEMEREKMREWRGWIKNSEETSKGEEQA